MSKYIKRVKRNDKIAKAMIIGGGVFVIGIVIGMLVIIASVALPLFYPANTEQLASVKTSESVKAIGVSEYLGNTVLVNDKSQVLVLDETGKTVQTFPVPHPAGATTAASSKLVEVGTPAPSQFALRWGDGAAALVELQFVPTFDAEGVRTIEPRLNTLNTWPPQANVSRSLFAATEDDEMIRIDLSKAGAVSTLRVAKLSETTDFLGNITKESSEGSTNLTANVTQWVLQQSGEQLYTVTDTGALTRWNISNPKRLRELETTQVAEDGATITALGFVNGDFSLAVGDSNGGLTTWMPVYVKEGSSEMALEKAHTLPSHSSKITTILPSMRDKSLYSVSDDGTIQGTHMTSERLLFQIQSDEKITNLSVSRRGNGIAFMQENGGVQVVKVDNPHPEVSVKTLFGKVHYEGGTEPVYAYQTSAADDTYEPKFSLTVLVFGSLKGTLYAMIFAIPISILGALYTSQFLRPQWRNTIKPAVEIMAAMPSVIIGFLAALWLAPLIEYRLPGVFLFFIGLPITVLFSLILWRALRQTVLLKWLGNGREFIGLMVILTLSVLLWFKLGSLCETMLFNGNFNQWVYDTFDIPVDQRNCIVISFALGFAVIPIIFTMSEDAMTMVPRSLSAASLAMGASRWQTAWKVVLPSASPAIFAAIMIGLGRAVGETMIVLMATGNTPIIDLSPFNGMRTLAANIATELPEAPHNGTLYRILFLSAVLLFIMTFVINTAAEVIRQRLRKKYGNY